MNNLPISLVNNPKYGKCIRKLIKIDSSITTNELNTLQKLNSPYYPKIYDFKIKENNYLIFEEFIGYPTLEVTKEKYYHNENECLNLLKELIIALEIIWQENITHPDLKLNNISINESNKPIILNLIKNKPKSSKNDNIHSLGIIIYELFYGQTLSDNFNKNNLKPSNFFNKTILKLLNNNSFINSQKLLNDIDKYFKQNIR